MGSVYGQAYTESSANFNAELEQNIGVANSQYEYQQQFKCNGNSQLGKVGDGEGYSSFSQLKNAVGSPGEGKHWHHIVEQSQIEKSGFSPEQVHNTSNIIAVDKATHAQISGYYNTKTFDFTNGLSVRDWLAGKSFEEQYEFGLNVLRMFGVI